MNRDGISHNTITKKLLQSTLKGEIVKGYGRRDRNTILEGGPVWTLPGPDVINFLHAKLNWE